MPGIKITDKDTIRISGTIDHSGVVSVRDELASFVEGHARAQATIDLSELETVNSIVLSLLLSQLRLAKSIECDLHFEGMPPRLYQMARVGGIETFLS